MLCAISSREDNSTRIAWHTLVHVLSQVQTNKQHISLLKGAVQEDIDEYRPVEFGNPKPTNRWSPSELHMGVQGISQLLASSFI